jgi:hypothetical protein
MKERQIAAGRTTLVIISHAVETDWERVQNQGIAEGATPVTAQAQELIGTGKSGERRRIKFA